MRGLRGQRLPRRQGRRAPRAWRCGASWSLSDHPFLTAGSTHQQRHRAAAWRCENATVGSVGLPPAGVKPPQESGIYQRSAPGPTASHGVIVVFGHESRLPPREWGRFLDRPAIQDRSPKAATAPPQPLHRNPHRPRRPHTGRPGRKTPRCQPHAQLDHPGADAERSAFSRARRRHSSRRAAQGRRGRCSAARPARNSSGRATRS